MERRDPISVKSYDPTWPESFERERSGVERALAPFAVGAVEHMGSTSVPGLDAKPIIDMVVPARSYRDGAAIVQALAAAGWTHDPQPDDKEMRRHSFCKPDPAWRTHHLHVVEARTRPWRQWLAFRDHLRADPEAVREYAQLKRCLAERHPYDREAYRAGKGEFVMKVLARGDAARAVS